MNKEFRNDINGLRAYAVLLVTLYHFKIPYIEGGFIGVDIFFVISGYLMAKIIIGGSEKEKINYKWIFSYYLSRSRRIIPALFVLCLVLLIFGWFNLVSTEFKNLATNSIASLLFFSNIKYWKQTNYFDEESSYNWLLHTWSLSVEWQFYIIFPLIIIIIIKKIDKKFLVNILLIIIAIISFIYSIEKKEEDNSFAFYMFITRAWEFLIGALLYINKDYKVLNKKNEGIARGIGLIIIIGSSVLIEKEMSWPGYLVLLPIIGTSLIIYFQEEKSKLFSAKIIQNIGTSSYSIYLWHWPIWVGLNYYEKNEIIEYKIIGLLLSLLIGWLSLKTIENPTRKYLNEISKLKEFTITISLLICSIYFLNIIRIENGFPVRNSTEVEKINREAENYNPRRNECHNLKGLNFVFCKTNEGIINAVVIGDSHASSMISAIENAQHNENKAILYYTYSSCPTILGIKIKNDENNKCNQFNSWALEEISKLDKDIPLIIINRDSAYLFGDNRINKKEPVIYIDEENIQNTNLVDKLLNENKKTICKIAETRKIYLTRPVPEMDDSVPFIASRRQMRNIEEDVKITRKKYENRNKKVIENQDKIKKECNIEILETDKFLCDNDYCYGEWQKKPMYYDSHHLSEFGNKKLIEMFKPIFK